MSRVVRGAALLPIVVGPRPGPMISQFRPGVAVLSRAGLQILVVALWSMGGSGASRPLLIVSARRGAGKRVFGPSQRLR